MSQLHQAAINLANAGIPVFPCVANAKVPATANGFKDATTDLETIAAWWTQDPQFNIGVCPNDAGWCVIDLDPPGGLDAWAGLLAQQGRDAGATYTVRTPRGGRHLYFIGALPPTSHKLGDGIDTRGIGSYVLVPPSCVDGAHYSVEADCDLAPLPEWISVAVVAKRAEVAAAIDTLDLDGNVERARGLLAAYVQRADVAVEGRGGDDRTYRLCCEVLNLGLSAERAHELICDIWNPHCVPPWDSDELWTKVVNASQYAQNEAGAWAVAPAADTFRDALDRLPPDARKPERRSRFHAETEDEQELTPEAKWLVRDVLQEATTAMLLGKTQSYKSFLALDIALGVSAGQETFGTTPDTGPVFYAALEGKANIKRARRRAWKLGRQVEAKLENFYVLTAPMIAVDSEVQEFGDEVARVCAGRRPKLIVLDTVAKCMVGLNENDARDAGRFVRFCDSLVEAFGCTVLAIHHMGKDDARGGRGSSALHAGFDTVIEVKASRATKAVEAWVRKHKDADERETPWTFQGRLVGPSLVFFPTNPDEHRALSLSEDEYEPRKIGAALQHLGAYGLEKSVTTQILAAELTPQLETETLEQRNEHVTRTSRKLSGLAKARLAAYCTTTPHGLKWFLPAPQ